MGQKVNPHGVRVGLVKEWISQWYGKQMFTFHKKNKKNWNLKINIFDFSVIKAKQFIRTVLQKVKRLKLRLRLPRKLL